MPPFKEYIILDVRPRAEYTLWEKVYHFNTINFPVPIAPINGSARARIYNDLVEFMRGRPRDAFVFVYSTLRSHAKMIVEFLADMGWHVVSI